MRARIFHITTAEDWETALRAGTYTRSTVGRDLAEVGFLHVAYAHQWRETRRRHFNEVQSPLVLLEIDTERLTSPVREEQSAPGTGEIYPHIYGPLNVDAVVSVRDLSRHPEVEDVARRLGPEH